MAMLNYRRVATATNFSSMKPAWMAIYGNPQEIRLLIPSTVKPMVSIQSRAMQGLLWEQCALDSMGYMDQGGSPICEE